MLWRSNVLNLANKECDVISLSYHWVVVTHYHGVGVAKNRGFWDRKIRKMENLGNSARKISFFVGYARKNG